jgi:2-keto-3-deoxy-L-fuconate dehydrogenase
MELLAAGIVRQDPETRFASRSTLDIKTVVSYTSEVYSGRTSMSRAPEACMPESAPLSASGPPEFDGMSAVVTGGSSGIGLATACLLAERGARFAILDRDPLPRDEQHRARLTVFGADVARDDEVRAAIAAAASALGGIDILVNNAGIGAAGTVEANDDDEWRRVLDVNVLGIVRTTRAALPHLRTAARRRGQAAIVNTCSIAATAGLPQRALYSASKGAVYSLTLAMAADHVAEHIRVTCVTPGTADTPWVARLLEAAADPVAERAALAARQPTGRLVSALEVAAAIAYLASPLAGAVTGMALAVDGGMSGLRLRPTTPGE